MISWLISFFITPEFFGGLTLLCAAGYVFFTVTKQSLFAMICGGAGVVFAVLTAYAWADNRGYARAEAELKPVIAEWEAKWAARDAADKKATEAASVASVKAKAAQDKVVKTLADALALEKAKPPKVVVETKLKEVIREVEKQVNAACIITDGFVRLRDISFYPDQASGPPEVAGQATFESGGTDSGLKAAEVAAADGRLIGQCRQALADQAFNLNQWEEWHNTHGAAWEDYRRSIETINAGRDGP